MTSTRFTRPQIVLGILLVLLVAASLWLVLGREPELSATFVVSEFKEPGERASAGLADSAASVVVRGINDTVKSGIVGAFLDGPVRNSGEVTLREVELTIPNLFFACINAEMATWNCRHEGDVIHIGDLQPHTASLVQAWLVAKPSRTAYNDIHLTHENGNGAIRFKAVDVPSGPLGRYTLFLGMIGLLGLLALHRYLAEQYANKRVQEAHRDLEGRGEGLHI